MIGSFVSKSFEYASIGRQVSLSEYKPAVFDGVGKAAGTTLPRRTSLPLTLSSRVFNPALAWFDEAALPSSTPFASSAHSPPRYTSQPRQCIGPTVFMRPAAASSD